jgi:hypothetical protein
MYKVLRNDKKNGFVIEHLYPAMSALGKETALPNSPLGCEKLHLDEVLLSKSSSASLFVLHIQ